MLLAFDTATPLVTVALHDGEDVVAERRSEQRMKHGEQLAPLIEAVLADAGIVRQDLTAIAVGVGPGPFTGLRVGLVTARTLACVLEIPVYGVCSLDVIAVEAAQGDAPPSRDFVVATDARRKEVYLASYDDRGRRLDGPDVVRPGDAATDAPVAGEGGVLYPEAFPAPMPARAAERRLAGAGGGRGARRAARPRAALPAPPRRGRPRDTEAGVVTVTPTEVRLAGPDDADAVAALEHDALGSDAWSHGLVAEGVAGRVPTTLYLVAESAWPSRLVGRAVLVGRACRATITAYAAVSIVADLAELQRIAVAAAHRRTGLASALLARVEHEALTRHADRLLLEVREDNHVACAFYAARGFTEIDRRPRYYADGTTAVILLKALS